MHYSSADDLGHLSICELHNKTAFIKMFMVLILARQKLIKKVQGNKILPAIVYTF